MKEIQILQEMKDMLLSQVDFKNGVIKDSAEQMVQNGLVLDVRWKGNVHLRFYNHGVHFRYLVVRNEEAVSPAYFAGRMNDFLNSSKNL